MCRTFRHIAQTLSGCNQLHSEIGSDTLATLVVERQRFALILSAVDDGQTVAKPSNFEVACRRQHRAHYHHYRHSLMFIIAGILVIYHVNVSVVLLSRSGGGVGRRHPNSSARPV